ncbi:DUF814 domain-containing protein [bacterium]|nr:DUF814 domain-containing protein [candidate division CSSED10-310 bacterium]
MDYFELKKSVECLHSILTGAHLMNVFQPETRCMNFIIRTRFKTSGDRILQCECMNQKAGIFLLEDTRQGDQAATLLARSFRKKMVGATIQSIEMPFPDRVVMIRFSLAEWRNDRELWIELYGSRSNITLVDTSSRVILDCLSKFPENTQKHPLRMPGRLFVSAWEHSGHRVQPLQDLVRVPDLWPNDPQTETVAARLRSGFAPMTPELSRTLAGIKIAEGTGAAINHLRTFFNGIETLFCSNHDDAIKYLISLSHRQSDHNAEERLAKNVNRLAKIISTAQRNCEKKINALEMDLSHIPDPTTLRRRADLLAINFHCLRTGMGQVEVDDIYDYPVCKLTIELDPEKNPSDNLKLLFRKAAKAERAGPRIKERLAILRKEWTSLDSLLEKIKAIGSPDECREVEKQLRATGFSLEQSFHNQRDIMLTGKPFLRFTSPDGWRVLVGRNARENDLLSFKESTPEDFWLHAQGYHGAHVIIRNPGKQDILPSRTVEFAASLAVRFSGARGEKAVTVICTKRKYVRRVPGNRPGLVRVTRHETVMIDSV